MSKINLADLSTITGNETSAINTINNNSTLIETFSDNTISRDGTTPNTMLDDFDMNSNRILNLPTPVSALEPLRLQDLSDFIGGGSIVTGAPTNASYVTLGTNATLSAERVLTAGNNVVLTDAGAGSTLTVATTSDLNPPSNDGGALGTTALKWSDLFLASGGVVNFNSSNALITHSTGALTFGASNCQYSGNVRPSINDVGTLGTSGLAWGDLFLADGGVINWNVGDVTLTHSTNTLSFAGASSGYNFDAVIKPNSNDAAALGVGGTAWSDLFLATGAVIDWGNNNATLTHSTNLLTSTAAWSQTGAMSILTATGIPAGGTTGSGYKFSNIALGIYFGSGLPTLSAAQGSLYLRTDGSSSTTRLYVNNNGTTGWTNMTSPS